MLAIPLDPSSSLSVQLSQDTNVISITAIPKNAIPSYSLGSSVSVISPSLLFSTAISPIRSGRILRRYLDTTHRPEDRCYATATTAIGNASVCRPVEMPAARSTRTNIST